MYVGHSSGRRPFSKGIVRVNKLDSALAEMDRLLKERGRIFEREGDKTLAYLEVTKQYHRAKEAWMEARLEAA